VVFGTSLSDSGNRFAITKEVSTPPHYAVDSFLIPDAPYPRGGHHLSNGPTWVEQFAKPLGMKKYVLPAFRDNNPHASNYATDGTRAGTQFNDKLILSDQIDFFLDDNGGTAPSQALYIVEMGSNDVRDAIVAFLEAPQNPPEAPFQAAEAVISTALSAIFANIGTLHSAGAMEFLILNVPPIGFTPALSALDAALTSTNPALPEGTIINLANSIALQFNNGLGDVLQLLKLTYPTINFTELDVHQKTLDILSDPEAYGLKEVEEACIKPDSPNFVCKKPDEYFFWDGTHPTQAAHAIYADAAAEALGL